MYNESVKVVKPPKLNIGDTIGIVASSLPVLPSFKENYERGKKVIYDLGFKIKEGKTGKDEATIPIVSPIFNLGSLTILILRSKLDIEL